LDFKRIVLNFSCLCDAVHHSLAFEHPRCILIPAATRPPMSNRKITIFHGIVDDFAIKRGCALAAQALRERHGLNARRACRIGLALCFCAR
jgi:hypothetical protein